MESDGIRIRRKIKARFRNQKDNYEQKNAHKYITDPLLPPPAKVLYYEISTERANVTYPQDGDNIIPHSNGEEERNAPLLRAQVLLARIYKLNCAIRKIYVVQDLELP